MTALFEPTAPTGDTRSSPRVKIRMLEQMAEALEDEANGLYRRAAAFEEEEFLLNQEIGERQTEVNRLLLKLEAMRAERDRVTEKIELISQEATAMREEVFNSEEEIALAKLRGAQAEGAPGVDVSGDTRSDGRPRSAMFFRRMTLAEQVPQT
jgi:chromosome segregation ATPase